MQAGPPPRRIYFHTFGCRANQYDTERMRQLLVRRGCVTVSDPGRADAVVVNSCTVTGSADSELRRYVRAVSRRSGGRVPVVVAGCAAAVAREKVRALEGVAAVVPGQDPEAVARSLGVLPRRPEEENGDLLERCERGTRSRAPQQVVEEARRLAGQHPEISLTGIHIGLYGKDLKPRVALAALLEALLDGVGDVRFRVGSLECSQLDDRVIDLMADSAGRLAPHVHVPLQSGSDRVLKMMRRAYLTRRYRERVERLAERVAPLGLGTDMIVGFPGETDGDHRRSVALIEALPFTYVHVFPYSERRGTDAEGLPDPVAPEVKAERSLEIRELVRRKADEHRRRRVGTRARVVLEGDDMETAVTGDYLKMPADDTLRAAGPRLQQAVIETARDGELRATAHPQRS